MLVRQPHAKSQTSLLLSLECASVISVATTLEVLLRGTIVPGSVDMLTRAERAGICSEVLSHRSAEIRSCFRTEVSAMGILLDASDVRF